MSQIIERMSYFLIPISILVVSIILVSGVFLSKGPANQLGYIMGRSDVSTVASGVLDIQSVRTSSGVEVWLVEDHSVPVISIDFAFQGAGSMVDPAGLEGLVRLVSNTLDEGAGDLDSRAFQKALQDHAISLTFSADRDVLSGTLKTIRTHKDKAFELLRLSLTQPRFDPEALERMKNANISSLRHYLSRPEWLTLRLAYHYGYGDHPYARNSHGTISGLGKVTPDDLRHYVATHLTRDRLKIGVSGDITAQEAAEAMDLIFSDLPAEFVAEKKEDGFLSFPESFPGAFSGSFSGRSADLQNLGKTIHYQMDIPQTYFQIWHRGIDRNSSDYAQALILNTILGEGGFGSRLMTKAREENGLTYGIYSHFLHMDQSDVLLIGTSTKNETAVQMLDLIHAEAALLRDEGVSAEELEKTRSFLMGALPLRFTSNGDISTALVEMQIHDLPIDHLDRHRADLAAVSVDEINQFARDFLTPENFMIVSLGASHSLSPADIIAERIPGVE